MKGFIRNIVIHAVALYLVSQIISGIKIQGGVETFLFGGFALSLISFFVKPILKILTLPFNLATMGAFSFLTNGLLLYLLTVFIPQISISPFVFRGATFIGFVIPQIAFNIFFAYIVCAFLLSIVTSIIFWLIE